MISENEKQLATFVSEDKFGNDVVKLAIAVLQENMQKDMDLAWGLHCNIKMCCVDTLVQSEIDKKEKSEFTRNIFKLGNKCAANIMQNIFTIDTTKCEQYIHFVVNDFDTK